jgi:hypothetical protein
MRSTHRNKHWGGGGTGLTVVFHTAIPARSHCDVSLTLPLCSSLGNGHMTKNVKHPTFWARYAPPYCGVIYVTSCLSTLAHRAVTLFSRFTCTVVPRFALTLIQSALLRNLKRNGCCLIVIFTKRCTTLKFIFLNLFYAGFVKGDSL